MERDEENLRRMIRESGFSALEDELMQFARSSIRIYTTRVEDEDTMAIGQSKIGGRPDLPSNFSWPVTEGTNPESMPFVGQIHLEDIKASDRENLLPAQGWLYFFGDYWVPQFKAKVIYFDGNISELIRKPFPDDVPPNVPGEFGKRFEPCSLRFVPEVNLGDEARNLEDKLSTHTDSKTWEDLYDLMRAANYCRAWEIVNRLLGTNYGAPNDMQRECQLIADTGSPYNSSEEQRASAERLKHEWQLLLQMDSDDNADMQWSDAGTIFFYIRLDDLKSGNFDNICLVSFSG